MSLVTLKKYLSDEELELRSIISRIFKGIVDTAVRSDEDEYEALKADIDRIEASISAEFTVEQLLVCVGAMTQALESYNHRTTKFVRRQGAELQKMVAMLAETVIRIAGSGERSVQALGQIRTQLEHAGGLEDLQAVKAGLATCLEQVCQESQRRKEESESVISELRRHVGRFASLEPAARRSASPEQPARQSAGPDQPDSVMDLPGREAAEAAIDDLSVAPGKKYLVVFVLDRLQSINGRFGTEVGDQVLAELTRHVKSNLASVDSLFRWSGRALVAIMPRQLTVDRMRSELGLVFSKPLQREFAVGGRNVMIPVSAAWSVFGLIPPVSTIIKHVDAFVTSQNPMDYV